MTADSPFGVLIFVVLMLGGATVGITVLAALASEVLRLVFSLHRDTDDEGSS